MEERQSPYKVRAVHCDYRASEADVYEALKRATDPLTESWTRLKRAKRIGIKFNQDKEPKNRVYYEGQLQQLVTEKVARAFLRLLRERTDAELVAPDVSFYTMYSGATIEETTTFAQVYRDFGVRYINGIVDEHRVVQVPGGGQMFREYVLPAGALDVDEFISVATLKNHAFMGITLSLKNLFGLMPGEPDGHTRTYYHHLVRMPYMLADLGRIFDPVLNIIDGTVAQAGREWGNGRDDGSAPRITNTLIAGNHISWRKTTAEQALYYQDHQRKLVDKYAGEYILLQEGEVKWHDPVSDLRGSRRKLAGDKPEQALWLKYVDPDEAEGEHFSVYDHALRQASVVA
jgi:hypothetical protein